MKFELSEVVRVKEEDKPDVMRVGFILNGEHCSVTANVEQSLELYTKTLFMMFERVCERSEDK